MSLSDRRRPLRGPRLFFIATAAVVVTRSLVTIVGSSTVALLHNLLSDDAFYYFNLARHFPRPEVTPGIATTGFHPLYWVLLAGPFHVLGHTAAVRAALVLLLATHVAIGVAIFVLVIRGGLGPWPGALAGAAWVASPALRQISLSGVEVPVAVLFTIMATAVLVNGAPTPRRWALGGLLAGLAVLARLDAVVVVGFVALERTLTWSRRPDNSSGPVRCLATLVAVGAAVTGTWVVWLALHSGLPDSARALRILRAHGVSVGQTGIGEVASQLARFLAGALAPVTDPTGAWRAGGGVVLLLLVVAGVSSRATRHWYGLWRGLLVGTALLYALYATVLGGIREWYQLYAAASLWLVVLPPGIAAVASRLESAVTHVRVSAAVLSGALVIALALSTAKPLFPNEADKYMAALIAPARLPRGASVGAFNSGVYTYFVPRRVVNLDGVVNPTVQSAIDHRTLCRYLLRHRVDWFLDSDKSLPLLRAFGPGVREIETFALSLEYHRRDPYPVDDPQVLVRLDTSAC